MNLILFYSIYGLNLRSCVGRIELYQVSKHSNVSRNYEQWPEMGGESPDFILQVILNIQE
jgi:hypothetical protein